MRAVRRVLTALIALAMAFFAVLGIATAGASVMGPGNGHIYAYDNSPHGAGSTFTTMQRGPPVTRDDATYDADGLLSLGSSARPNTAATRAVYDYNDRTWFVQAPRASSGGAEGRAGSVEAEPVAFQRSDLAANTGRGAANACRTNSFTGATLVLMADGTQKPIKDVKLGDKVMATDPETGETGPRKVSDLIRHGGLHTMVAVRLSDGSTIDATDHHPFWVEPRGEWVDAISLQPGDIVVTVDGDRLTVESLGISERDLVAYNLTVAGLHTYHVGAAEVLVHNCSGVDLSFGQVQDRIATHVVPHHGAGTPATGTKFAVNLGEDEIFTGLVERLSPSTVTGRLDELGNHEHILNWAGAGANGENRVRVWMSPNGELGGMWPIR